MLKLGILFELEELKVVVHGDFLPRQLFGMFHLLFAALRSLYLAAWLFFLCPFHYDVIIVDQVPFSIPILKHCADKILYYCHFPDKFLAPKSINPLRKLAYRYWFDTWEASTILKADKILVNSAFTADKFMEAFPKASWRPSILHPGVNQSNLDDNYSMVTLPWPSTSLVITSLNRFERKKNIKLVMESFAWLKKNLDQALFANLKLVIAGIVFGDYEMFIVI